MKEEEYRKALVDIERERIKVDKEAQCNEVKHRQSLISIDNQKVAIEKRKAQLENTFVKKNFGVIIAALASIVVSYIGFITQTSVKDSNDASIKQAEISVQKVVAERKVESYATYVSVVNQSWAMYKTKGSVDTSLRQKGIDAFEILRLVASDVVYEKAHIVNFYFSNLYDDYDISEEINSKFNAAMKDFKVAIRKELVFVQPQ